MTEEEKTQLEQLGKDVEDIHSFIKSLQSFSTLPFDIGEAIRERVGHISTSDKSTTSEIQAVNEAGTSAYNVQGLPANYLRVTVDGKIYYIPSYNA